MTENPNDQMRIHEIVALSEALGGKRQTYGSVATAIKSGKLKAERTAAVDSGFIVQRADAVAWLTRATPDGLTVDELVALSGRRHSHGSVVRAIKAGELRAELFGASYIVPKDAAATWLAR